MQARSSHHSGHIGIITTDGVSVDKHKNLFAIGDASTIGFWTEHRLRSSGLGLLKCLVDAAIVADLVQSSWDNTPFQMFDQRDRQHEATIDEAQLRDINSTYLHEWLDNEDTRDKIGAQWENALKTRFGKSSSTLFQISMATAFAHRKVGSGEYSEPFVISKETVETLQL